MIPAFDSGDHLHPGNRGGEAMAEAVDLKALLGRWSQRRTLKGSSHGDGRCSGFKVPVLSFGVVAFVPGNTDVEVGAASWTFALRRTSTKAHSPIREQYAAMGAAARKKGPVAPISNRRAPE
jgi:hypothetical protein